MSGSFNSCAAGLGLAALSLAAAADGPEPAPRWTLSEALEYALAHSPALGAQRAELRHAEADRLAAHTYPYNPQLTVEAAERRGLGGISTTDRGLALTQEVEVAGQRRARRAVADESLAAAGDAQVRRRRLLGSGVAMAFVEAVRARELLAVGETDLALTREMLDYSELRLERGASTQIVVNLARASAGRAERTVQRTHAAYAAARSRLAELAGHDPSRPPEPVGDLVFPAAEIPPLATALSDALERRIDLRASERRRRSAEAGMRLARAEGRPNLVVEAFLQREEGSDDIAGVALGIALPIFDRNRGAIARAQAVRDRLGHEQAALRLEVEREVVVAWNELKAARAAATRMRDLVLETLEENVALLQRAFTAGRIGATELVTLRRELVAAQLEHIEVLADAWQARIALDLATGHLALPAADAAGVATEEESP